MNILPEMPYNNIIMMRHAYILVRGRRFLIISNSAGRLFGSAMYSTVYNIIIFIIIINYVLLLLFILFVFFDYSCLYASCGFQDMLLLLASS